MCNGIRHYGYSSTTIWGSHFLVDEVSNILTLFIDQPSCLGTFGALILKLTPLYFRYYFCLNLATLTQLQHFFFLGHRLFVTFIRAPLSHICLPVFSHLFPPRTRVAAPPELRSLASGAADGCHQGQKLFQFSEAWKATKCLLCCWSAAQFFSYVNDVICRWTWGILTSSDEEGKPPNFPSWHRKPWLPRELRTVLRGRDREGEREIERDRWPAGVY